LPASLLAALAVGVVLGVVAARRARLEKRARRAVAALFAASVAMTLFSVGLGAGYVDPAVLPSAILYAVASGFAAVAAAWALLRLWAKACSGCRSSD